MKTVKVIALTLLFAWPTCLLAAEIEALVCTNEHIAASTPSSDFELLHNGHSVRHLPTQLIWRRCPAYTNWNGQHCVSNPSIPFVHETRRTGWAPYKELDENIQEFYPEWRLPNIKELASLREYCSEDQFNRHVFPKTLRPDGREESSTVFWSSTPAPPNDVNVLGVVDGHERTGLSYSVYTSGIETQRTIHNAHALLVYKN